MKINLKDVTLCVADSVTPNLSVRAINKSQEQCIFGRSILFTDAQVDRHGDFDVVKIDKLNSLVDYSQFILKRLNSYIKTRYVLIIQWDGYVLDSDCWRDDFLGFDYIGAKWNWHKDGNTVGNGGFSFRSKKLLEATSSSDFIFVPDLPEDVLICRSQKNLLIDKYLMRFADEGIADCFSYERSVPDYPTFGFHGLFNMWRHCGDNELLEIVENLNKKSYSSREYLELMIQYFSMKNFKQLRILYFYMRKNLSVEEVRNHFGVQINNEEFVHYFSRLCEKLIN